MAKRDLHNVLFPKQRKILAQFGQDLLLAMKRRGFTKKRLHFSSAMTQLRHFVDEKYDGEQSQGASYLEIAEFISNSGSQTEADLAQLWRRIVFNIAVSNTDAHLRNPGFY